MILVCIVKLVLTLIERRSKKGIRAKATSDWGWGGEGCPYWEGVCEGLSSYLVNKFDVSCESDVIWCTFAR